MAEPKRTIRFQFPVTPERVPQYVNIALANHVNGDVVLDFGFLDPFCLPPAASPNGPEPSGVPVQPVVRVAMNARAAEQLYHQLHQVLGERRRQRLGKHYPPRNPMTGEP